jgi:hypothetical protein
MNNRRRRIKTRRADERRWRKQLRSMKFDDAVPYHTYQRAVRRGLRNGWRYDGMRDV